MSYLGFWLICKSVASINKKIEYVKNMMPQTNQKGLSNLIGVLSYQRDMFGQRFPHTETLNYIYV